VPAAPAWTRGTEQYCCREGCSAEAVLHAHAFRRFAARQYIVDRSRVHRKIDLSVNALRLCKLIPVAVKRSMIFAENPGTVLRTILLLSTLLKSNPSPRGP